MSYGLRPYGTRPYGVVDNPATGPTYTLTVDAASFTLTGVAVSLTVSRLLAVGTGEFTLTGNDVGLTARRYLAAGTGEFVLSGVDVDLVYGVPEVPDTGPGGGWIDPATARKLIRQAKAFQKAIDDKRTDKERRQAQLLASLERTYHAITGEPLPESADHVAEVIAQQPATTPVQRVADAVAVYAVVAAMNDRSALDEAYEALDRALMMARIVEDEDDEIATALWVVDDQNAQLMTMVQGAHALVKIMEMTGAALRL